MTSQYASDIFGIETDDVVRMSLLIFSQIINGHVDAYLT
jgi:hypothetical protein